MNSKVEIKKHKLIYSDDKSLSWIMQELNTTEKVTEPLRNRSRSGGFVAWPSSPSVTSTFKNNKKSSDRHRSSI